MDFATVGERVESLLEEFELARGDDRFLIAAYMMKFHGISTFKEYYLRKDSPTVESIRRIRQKIQAKGLFPPVDEKVVDGRIKAEGEYHQFALEV